MLTFRCQNCGAELCIDSSGALVCEYCGSHFFFSDEQLRGYRAFRRQMLNYLRDLQDEKEVRDHNEDLLWTSAETEHLRTADGIDVTLRYLYSHEDGHCKLYMTRDRFLFYYRHGNRFFADGRESSLSMLSYPPADVKGLKECFPVPAGRYELEDGGLLLTYLRPANVFPLSHFGALLPEHAAWVVSRLENICCVLEYSGILHGGISENSVFINPFEHHAILMGGWEKAGRKRAGDIEDMKDLRKTADRVLGTHRDKIPREFRDFLKGRPKADAYEDFALWDTVIEKGFGGRRFAKMNM